MTGVTLQWDGVTAETDVTGQVNLVRKQQVSRRS
jgi:hypothetical protein